MNRVSYLLLVITLSVWSCKLFQSNSSPSAVFTITPITGTIDTVFMLDASGSNDEEDSIDNLEIRWDWENDGTFDTEWTVNKTATHQYNSRGQKTIKLQVKDKEDLTDTALGSLEIIPSAPTASFSISPNEGSTSIIFTFDASSCTDYENDISELKVRWDWENDGNWDTNMDTLKVITHKFLSPSNYTVALEVLNTDGLKDTVTMNLEVSVGTGAFITEDTILNEDLQCSRDDPEALNIKNSNITLDLGGHTITNSFNDPDKNGIVLRQVDNVTIKNGIIEGFMRGIDVNGSTNITIEDVVIKNMRITDPAIFIFGINMENCGESYIYNSRFEFPLVYHKISISWNRSYVNVDNVEIIGGGVGVDLGAGDACNSESTNNGGTISNSKFVGAGVLIACSDSILVQGNEFDKNEFAINAYGEYLGSIKNVTIEDNFIHDGNQGIVFYGVTESIIDNNIIQNNGANGIWMNQCHECELGIQPNPFYSTGNTISNNTVTGNNVDLRHHIDATGNTWINNTCQTKEGAEIPECTQ